MPTMPAPTTTTARALEPFAPVPIACLGGFRRA
jgi:hypothetical protein